MKFSFFFAKRLHVLQRFILDLWCQNGHFVVFELTTLVDLSRVVTAF